MHGLIIELLRTDPLLYAIIVFCAIVSITLHELAHGWAGIYLGDDTPIRTGHMTWNPVVHMGVVSFICVFLVGFGWGSMPCDRSQRRGRYANAIVSFAGPAMNLLLCAVGLAGLVIMIKTGVIYDDANVWHNLQMFLFELARLNLFLAAFNLLPIPPLDGSWILADFNSDYKEFAQNNRDFPGLAILGIMFLQTTPYAPSIYLDMFITWFLQLFF